LGRYGDGMFKDVKAASEGCFQRKIGPRVKDAGVICAGHVGIGGIQGRNAACGLKEVLRPEGGKGLLVQTGSKLLLFEGGSGRLLV